VSLGGNQKTGGSWLSWCRKRQHEGRLHRIRPRACGKHAGGAGEIGYLVALLSLHDPSQRPRPRRGISVVDWMVLRKSRRAVRQSGSGDATRAGSVFVQQVDHREWNIQRIPAQDFGRVLAGEFGTPLLRQTGAEIAQRRQQPHADDPPGGLGASAENALDRLPREEVYATFGYSPILGEIAANLGSTTIAFAR